MAKNKYAVLFTDETGRLKNPEKIFCFRLYKNAKQYLIDSNPANYAVNKDIGENTTFGFLLYNIKGDYYAEKYPAPLDWNRMDFGFWANKVIKHLMDCHKQGFSGGFTFDPFEKARCPLEHARFKQEKLGGGSLKK